MSVPTPANDTGVVLIVDDEPTVLCALRSLLRRAGIDSVTADGGEEALAILHAQSDSIGAVVSDYGMPGMNGAELLRAVRLHWPDIARALLTGSADFGTAVRAVNEGHIARLLVKPWDPAGLQREVMDLLVDRRRLVEHRQLRAQVDTFEQAAAERRLSARELDVLRLLVEGLTNREIAQRLVVSPATVKIHVANITSKLGARDRTQAAVRAIELGLVALSEPAAI